MSRRGNCHDNAVAESFFQLLKRERIKRHIYASRDNARTDVVDYIEGKLPKYIADLHVERLVNNNAKSSLVRVLTEIRDGPIEVGVSHCRHCDEEVILQCPHAAALARVRHVRYLNRELVVAEVFAGLLRIM